VTIFFRLVRLFLWQAKIKFMRSMEYRFDFFMGVIVSLAFSSLGPLIQYLIFTNTKGFPGWNLEQIILFQGMLVLWFGLRDTLFGEVPNLINTIIIRGELDKLLLKPFPAAGILLASGFNYYGGGSILAGIIIMVFISIKMGITIGIAQLALFFLFVVFGIVLYMAVMLLYCSIILIVVYQGRVGEIINKLLRFSEFPLEIFPHLLKLVFITVLPYAVWAYLPVQALLNRIDGLAILSGLSCLLLLWLSLKFWEFQLKKYTSAGG
jgi:ABC-2 type transport system permease protein